MTQMIAGKLFGNVLKAGLVCACVYGIMNWEVIKSEDDETGDSAKKSCVDEIGDRYDASRVRAYEVNENINGYVVRATVTMAKGTTAKVNCLTNAHGRVKEIMIEER